MHSQRIEKTIVLHADTIVTSTWCLVWDLRGNWANAQQCNCSTCRCNCTCGIWFPCPSSTCHREDEEHSYNLGEEEIGTAHDFALLEGCAPNMAPWKQLRFRGIVEIQGDFYLTASACEEGGEEPARCPIFDDLDGPERNGRYCL